MLRIEDKQASYHTALYNKIPKNHILRIIDETIDFTFIEALVRDSYSKHMGRTAKDPIMMCKLLFLQKMYNLSDVRLIEDAQLNLAHLYFLHLNPEDELPDASLVSKFRCHRIDEVTLDDIITEIVRQCVAQGIISGSSVSIDATHISANTFNNTAERLMKKIARKVITTHQKDDESFTSSYEEPDYEVIEDHREAKRVMLDYACKVIAEVEDSNIAISPSTKAVIEQSQEIMSDPKFIVQKGARSLIDQDARVGRKSKTVRFYGYKAEFLMTTEENIITAICTENGAYTDGNNTKELLDRTIESGVNVKEFYGDKAYFRKGILDEVERIDAKAYIPVHRGMYKMDETRFSYNKDADEWSCHLGNTSEKRKHFKSSEKGVPREGYKYYFSKEQCEHCPERENCTQKGSKYKVLNVGTGTARFYALSQEQKDPDWLDNYHKRASIESKNAELKRFHGLSRAKGYSLESMSKQAKLTAVAVNLKTIGRLVAKKRATSLILNVLIDVVLQKYYLKNKFKLSAA